MPTTREYVEHKKILDLKSSGISRKNFAKRLVAMIFTEAERSKCNVNGRNKPKLDPIRINYVKNKTFQMYPLNPLAEKLEKAWSECVIAIDEGNRRLNRKINAHISVLLTVVTYTVHTLCTCTIVIVIIAHSFLI